MNTDKQFQLIAAHILAVIVIISSLTQVLLWHHTFKFNEYNLESTSPVHKSKTMIAANQAENNKRIILSAIALNIESEEFWLEEYFSLRKKPNNQDKIDFVEKKGKLLQNSLLYERLKGEKNLNIMMKKRANNWQIEVIE